MKKIILLILLFLMVLSCDKFEFNSPYDPEYVLLAPDNLQTEQSTVNTCKITWQDNAEKEVGYKIERKTTQKQQLSSHKILENNTKTVSNKLQDCKNDKQLLVKAKNLTKTQKPDSINTKSNWEIIAALEAEEEEYTDTDLNPYADYNYRVYAYAGENVSEKKEKSVNMQFPSPTNFVIEQTSFTSLKLNWNYNMPGIDGFLIDRKVNNNSWVINYANTNSNTEEYEDTDVLLETTYNYRVYAYSGENYSDYVETGSIDNKFPAPTELQYEILSPTSLQLQWEDNSNLEEGFIIERKVNEDQWSELNSVSANVTEYVDNTINDEDNFYYRVCAYLGANQSGYSNEIYFLYDPEDFIFVQGGTFDMGDHYDEGYDDELPVHSVTLDDYYIGETEVTHQQVIDVFNWAYSQGYINCSSFSVTNNQGDSQELLDLDGDCAIDWNGSSLEFGGSDVASSADCPCIEISWYGSVAFCNYKSLQDGLDTCYDLSDWSCDFNANGYCLPTEAEWEYAARGGVHWTDDYSYSGCHTEANLPDYAWYNANAGGETHPVGTKLPNQLAIYDMSGNVYEWCNDWYDSNYYSSSPSANPTGPNSGFPRVARSGGWGFPAYYCRVANRHYYYPYDSYGKLGFRILRLVTSK